MTEQAVKARQKREKLSPMETTRIAFQGVPGCDLVFKGLLGHRFAAQAARKVVLKKIRQAQAMLDALDANHVHVDHFRDGTQINLPDSSAL